MACLGFRVRRIISPTSFLITHHLRTSSSYISSPSSSSSSVLNFNTFPLQNPNSYEASVTHTSFQSIPCFRCSPVSMFSSRSYKNEINDDDKISPDTILFEGCDYNHWLITMEFPDPKPSPEEMVETYVQTLAKVVGSVEEAKKRMYACSTTTYTGFQAVMTEEMSEKFRGLPGVVFILPDSYIDPANKEYGGDKYINGTIIPRPPPVQFARSSGRRGHYPQQGVQQNYPQQGAQPNYSQQNYRPTPSYQGNYNQGGNYYSQERRDFPQGGQREHGHAEQRDFIGDNRNFPPPPPGAAYQQGGGPGYGPNYPGEGQRYSPVEQGSGMQGQQRNYTPMGHTGTDQGRN
ncbi:hypothetical protein RJ641_018820 [Dillenia turbinata]|uniref:MORF/ORRM1/DAG-like MORF domain-containing protein n=1 Tax=Dillenia turbinata TaxID=194707 RepID=A0AAN8YUV5_9MAGN